MNQTNQRDKAPRWAWTVLIVISLLPILIGAISGASELGEKLHSSSPSANAPPYPPPLVTSICSDADYAEATDVGEIRRPLERTCWTQVTLPASWPGFDLSSTADKGSYIWFAEDGRLGWKWYPPQSRVDFGTRGEWKSVPSLRGIYRVITIRVAGEGELILRETDPRFR